MNLAHIMTKSYLLYRARQGHKTDIGGARVEYSTVVRVFTQGPRWHSG
jgi:hypothetical protein